ncbi:MAG TPA: ribosomal protein S18-alanine N-acetyltransferase [Syntrophales bacterium]|nr:ribosomal protein S18-alanine N-acetyltransferase [Syntrophales bacterium]
MGAVTHDRREDHRPDQASLTVRKMEENDLKSVIEIERNSFKTPWSEVSFLEELRVPFCHSFVALSGEVIAGSIHFAIIVDEIHLRNVAVQPGYRRGGIATFLMKTMIAYGREKGAFLGFLEVRRSNRPALRLYEKFGFRKRGIRPLYYADTCEDAVIMTADFSSNNEGEKKGQL